MLQFLAALKSLAKIVDGFRWLWQRLSAARAESQHATNASAIDSAVDAAVNGVRNDQSVDESHSPTDKPPAV